MFLAGLHICRLLCRVASISCLLYILYFPVFVEVKMVDFLLRLALPFHFISYSPYLALLSCSSFACLPELSMSCFKCYFFYLLSSLSPQKTELVRKNDLLYFADICSAPGGFSEYVLWRRRQDMAKGFGFTLKSGMFSVINPWPVSHVHSIGAMHFILLVWQFLLSICTYSSYALPAHVPGLLPLSCNTE